MSNTEILARGGVDIIAIQRITRCKSNRMHDGIQTIPVLTQLFKHIIDVFIAADIAFNKEIGADFGGGREREFPDQIPSVRFSALGKSAVLRHHGTL